VKQREVRDDEHADLQHGDLVIELYAHQALALRAAERVLEEAEPGRSPRA
jgi:hypothetical protein